MDLELKDLGFLIRFIPSLAWADWTHGQFAASGRSPGSLLPEQAKPVEEEEEEEELEGVDLPI